MRNSDSAATSVIMMAGERGSQVADRAQQSCPYPGVTLGAGADGKHFPWVGYYLYVSPAWAANALQSVACVACIVGVDAGVVLATAPSCSRLRSVGVVIGRGYESRDFEDVCCNSALHRDDDNGRGEKRIHAALARRRGPRHEGPASGTYVGSQGRSEQRQVVQTGFNSSRCCFRPSSPPGTILVAPASRDKQLDTAPR